MGLDLTIERLALNPDQVAKYHLQNDPAQDQKGPGHKLYFQHIGKVLVELDALTPDDLQSIVRGGIERNLRLPQF
jgi:hypothetical protein